METVLDIKAIKKILPHKYPFLLVDKVVSLKRGPRFPENRGDSQIIAIKNVTINEPFFQGHFDFRPVMPGVLIVEAAAQASTILAFRPGSPEQDVALLGLNNVKFRRAVVPGDTLEIHSTLAKDRGATLVFECKIYVDKELVAELEILSRMYDKKKEDL